MIAALGLPIVSAPAQVQGAAALPDAADKTDRAARQFEGLLMGMLFQTMRRTVEPSGLLGDSGQSRTTYEYLMDQAVVEHAVTAGRGWGLAERLKADWSRQTVPPGSVLQPSPEKIVQEKDVPAG